MTNLRWSLPDGEDTTEPLALWFVRAQCVRAGFPMKRGNGFAPREDGVDLSALEFAIDRTYFLGDALGELSPDLAARVLAADPSGAVPLDATADRTSLSDGEVAELHAASRNFATERRRTQPDPEWLPWWWLGGEGFTGPHTGRASMHVMVRRFFAVHLLYGAAHPGEFWTRAERHRQDCGERTRTGRLPASDPDGLRAWAEETVEAFQRINGPLPVVCAPHESG